MVGTNNTMVVCRDVVPTLRYIYFTIWDCEADKSIFTQIKMIAPKNPDRAEDIELSNDIEIISVDVQRTLSELYRLPSEAVPLIITKERLTFYATFYKEALQQYFKDEEAAEDAKQKEKEEHRRKTYSTSAAYQLATQAGYTDDTGEDSYARDGKDYSWYKLVDRKRFELSTYWYCQYEVTIRYLEKAKTIKFRSTTELENRIKKIVEAEEELVAMVESEKRKSSSEEVTAMRLRHLLKREVKINAEWVRTGHNGREGYSRTVYTVKPCIDSSPWDAIKLAPESDGKFRMSMVLTEEELRKVFELKYPLEK